jgi:5-methylcytosine-specific restriction endonuclease McrA
MLGWETIKRHYLNLTAKDGASLNCSWQKCKREFFKTVPKRCVMCGYKKEIQLHHVIPRHICPERAVDHTNLIALCRDCHFHSAHMNNYHNYNKNIMAVAFYANEHSAAGVVL